MTSKLIEQLTQNVCTGLAIKLVEMSDINLSTDEIMQNYVHPDDMTSYINYKLLDDGIMSERYFNFIVKFIEGEYQRDQNKENLKKSVRKTIEFRKAAILCPLFRTEISDAE